MRLKTLYFLLYTCLAGTVACFTYLLYLTFSNPDATKLRIWIDHPEPGAISLVLMVCVYFLGEKINSYDE